MRDLLKDIFRTHFILVVSLLCTAIIFGRAIFFAQIAWDDPEMVFQNRDVIDFNLQTLWSKHYVGNYIPVTMTLHAVVYAIFGKSESAHHVFNLLLHLVNGILIYRFSQLIFKENIYASICAIVFLLHPVQVETTVWISELKNILSTTFLILCLLAYQRFSINKKITDYIPVLLFALLACFSKSSAVILPLLIAVIELFILRKKIAQFVPALLPLFLISFTAGFINLQTQSADQFINYSHAFPYHIRFANAGWAILNYLLNFIFPFKLSVIYPFPEPSHSVFIYGLICWTGFAGLFYFFYKKQKWKSLFAILFFIINLLLVLQFVPFGEALYADRYMYLAIAGLAWLLAAVMQHLKLNLKLIASVLIAALSFTAAARVHVWRTTISLYENVLKRYPDNFVTLNSAGVEYMMLGEHARSARYFDRAIASSPNNHKSYYNKGLLYLKMNKPENAIRVLNQAIKIYDYNKAYVARARAYYLLKDFPKAIQDARHVLESEPGNAKAHFVLGDCYNSLNRLEPALQAYNKCIELDLNAPEFYFKRAIVYGKMQDFTSALSDLNFTLELDPENTEAYYWRGVVKVNLRQDPCRDFAAASKSNFAPASEALNRYCK